MIQQTQKLLLNLIFINFIIIFIFINSINDSKIHGSYPRRWFPQILCLLHEHYLQDQ